MADNKHQLSEQDDAEAGAVEAAPPPDPATASAAEPTVESMDDTASIPLGDTFSSLPRIEDVPPEPADDQASEPEGERMVPDAAESLPAEPAPEPSADQPESSSSVPSHLAPEQPKVRQQSGRNRPGWILPVIGGVAAVAAAAGLGLSIYSFATGSKTGDVHISNPIELVQSAQEDTTRDASEILTATESLTLDGADVSLPQNRTEVDVRDGKVMVTYRTQEAEAETYERATRAAAALALNLNGMSVQSSTTRTGMSDEVLPPTVAEDENSNGDSGHYGYYNEYGYYTWGYSNKKTIATPDLDVILSTGDGTEQATSVTVVAIDGNNQACLAVTLGVANATGVSTADDVITAAQNRHHGLPDDPGLEQGLRLRVRRAASHALGRGDPHRGGRPSRQRHRQLHLQRLRLQHQQHKQLRFRQLRHRREHIGHRGLHECVLWPGHHQRPGKCRQRGHLHRREQRRHDDRALPGADPRRGPARQRHRALRARTLRAGRDQWPDDDRRRRRHPRRTHGGGLSGDPWRGNGGRRVTRPRQCASRRPTPPTTPGRGSPFRLPPRPGCRTCA